MEDGKKPGESEYVVLRSERRRNLRKQLLVLKVMGEDRKGVFFGYAKTLGRGGMFIASVNPKNVGEEFEISFTLPDDKTEVKCKAAVVWRREYDPYLKAEPGMGISFIGLSEEVRDRIGAWVEKEA